MASIYTNDLRLEEIGSGEQSGSWGDTTNTNLELIAEAFAFGTEAITTNADTHATTIADGATDPGRALFLKYTGTLDSACTITLGPNTVSKMWFIQNSTSGSQNIIISQGSGANVTIPAGQTKAVYSNGAGSGAAIVDAFATLNVVDLLVDDDLTVTDDATVGGTLGVTGVLTTTAATVFNGGFAANDGSTITTADNSDNLTLTSTDADASAGPNLNLYRNSASPADSDFLGNIKFNGRNDNSQDVQYAEIEVYAMDVSDGAEDGLYNLNVMTSGTNTSYMQIRGELGEIVFNESSVDVDFRVESNGNMNMLFVDGGNNAVGIGNNVAASMFGVGSMTIGTGASGEEAVHTVYSNSNTYGALYFADATSGTGRYQGGIDYLHSTDALRFYSSAAQRMTIFSSGNVGIGTSSFTNVSNYKFLATNDSTGGGLVCQQGGTNKFAVYNANNDGYYDVTSNHIFRTGGAISGTERMRLDSSGNLLVGKSAVAVSSVGAELRDGASDYAVTGVSSAQAAALFGRNSDDGDIIRLRKDNAAVGSIGTKARTSAGRIFVGNSNTRLLFDNGVDAIIPADNDGADRDNAIDLGASGARFDDIFATNGTIQTSDANEKQDIAALTSAEMLVAKRISALFKTFRWKDKVAEKGDNARTHTGIIAQDVQSAFTAEGLDAGDYSLFISSTWWEHDVEVPAVEAVAEVTEDVVIAAAVEEELDEEGNVSVEAQEERTEQRVTEAVEAVDAYTRTDTYGTQSEAPAGATSKTRMGIRYPELLSFVAAYNEQRFAAIETRLTALENA